MTRIGKVVFLLVSMHLPFSCIVTDECEDKVARPSRIGTLSAQIGTYTDAGFSNERSDDFEAAAIQVRIMNTYVVAQARMHSLRDFSLIHQAYACDPPPPYPTQAIQTITITSNAPVYSGGRTFSPGADLSDLFKIQHHGYVLQEFSVDSFLYVQNQEFGMFGYANDAISFQLIDQPDSTIQQPFRFDFLLSGQETATVISEKFEVSN